jgi:hypothetical protein
MRKWLLIALFYLVAHVNAQTSLTCQKWQTFDTPRNAHNATEPQCSSYNDATCCDYGSRIRAMNWAYEDDGCGIVRGKCLVMSVELACFMNCAPQSTVLGTSTIPRAVISTAYAKKIWEACKEEQWCGVKQKLASTCVAFQKVTVRSHRRYSEEVVTTSNMRNTCTVVSDLSYLEFADRILDFDVHDNGAEPSPQKQVPNSSTTSTTSLLTGFLLGMAVLFLTRF